MNDYDNIIMSYAQIGIEEYQYNVWDNNDDDELKELYPYSINKEKEEKKTVTQTELPF